MVHTKGSNIRFEHCPDSGFPFINLDKHSKQDKAAMLVESVHGDYKGFTKRDIEKAKATRELEGKNGHHSDKDFKELITHKDNISQSILHDSLTTLTDIANSKNRMLNQFHDRLQLIQSQGE